MNNFQYNLENILEELNEHKNDRAKLLESYITKRLNESLNTYYEQLNKSIDYLNTKDNLKIIKKLNKED